MSDDAETAIQRRKAPDFGLFAPEEGEPTSRLSAALASAEGSATATEDRLVASITEKLRTLHRFTTDTVGDYCDAAGVPHLLATRRRVCSRVVNGGRAKGYWRKRGPVMTRRADRSGRYVTEWECVHPDEER